MNNASEEEGCPACGMVPCLKCFTDVGQILASANEHMPDVEAALDTLQSALRYLEKKAGYRDDPMASRLLQSGSSNLHAIRRRVSGLRQLIQIMALGLAFVVIGLGGSLWHTNTLLVEARAKDAASSLAGSAPSKPPARISIPWTLK